MAAASTSSNPPPTASLAPPLAPIGGPPPTAMTPVSSAPASPPPAGSATNTHPWKVVGVHAGDTVTCIDENNQQQKICLAEIDAPEVSQDFGQRLGLWSQPNPTPPRDYRTNGAKKPT